ncbi:MAG: DUF2155 domain-containing protein, partial [Rhodospirillales bacterium]
MLLQVVATGLLASVVSPVSAETYAITLLQALDKVTARVITLQAPVGETVRFGTLEIRAAVCEKRPPEETPDSAAFLDIVEKRAGQAPVEVFRGWMFASSPGLSPMQHPVYDLWVVDCVSSLPSAAP